MTRNNPMPASTSAEESEQDVSVDLIDPSPLNPRVAFNADELETLAESLRNHGQLQNVLLWRKPGGRFELIAGERRWRAAKLAGLAALRAAVLDVDEPKAIELRGVENAQRVDLSAIELGRWYQQLIELCGYTQQALADRLKLSQPTIANRLRLLKLPDEWQRKVISREISESHARHLLPWCDLPAVLTRLAAELEKTPAPSLREWAEAIRQALYDFSRPTVLGEWFDRPVCHGKEIRSAQAILTSREIDENAEGLDIRDMPAGPYQQASRRAFNVARYDELHAAALRRHREVHAASAPATNVPKKETTNASVRSPMPRQAPVGITLDELMNRIAAVCAADPPSPETTLKIWSGLSMTLASSVAGNEGCPMDGRVVSKIAEHGLQEMRSLARTLRTSGGDARRKEIDTPV